MTARQAPTMRDLGAFWIADNLATARAELHRCEKALASKTPGDIYAQQIEKLVAARRDVVAVWERHLEGPAAQDARFAAEEYAACGGDRG